MCISSPFLSFYCDIDVIQYFWCFLIRVQLPYSGSGFLIEKFGGFVVVSDKVGLTLKWNQKDSLMVRIRKNCYHPKKVVQMKHDIMPLLVGVGCLPHIHL